MNEEILTPEESASQSDGMTQTMKEVRAIETGLKQCGVSIRAFLRGNAAIMGLGPDAQHPCHQTTWSKWKRGACEPTLGSWREVLRHYERILRNRREWLTK